MTCAFAVRGAIKKFAGVESVDVSLNKGLATVKLKPGNTVMPEQLWEAVKKNGFTPKETHVVVRGDALLTSGKMHLRVTGTNSSYELVGPVATKTLIAKPFTVEGDITPGKDSKTPSPIRVQSVRP